MTAYVRKGTRDTLGPMKAAPAYAAHHVRRQESKPSQNQGLQARHPKPGEKHRPSWDQISSGFWESKKLKERDLNIPSGDTTNATGSMNWKQGEVKDIDQRHFMSSATRLSPKLGLKETRQRAFALREGLRQFLHCSEGN